MSHLSSSSRYVAYAYSPELSPEEPPSPTLRDLHGLSEFDEIDNLVLPLEPTPPEIIESRPQTPPPAPVAAPVVVQVVETPPNRPRSSLSTNPTVSTTSIPTPSEKNLRNEKYRKLIDESDFLVAGLNGVFDEPWQKRKAFGLMARDTLMTILDYMEDNLLANKTLPRFPDRFHNQIADLAAYATFSGLKTDNIKIYTFIHDCVKAMPNCQDVPFSHFSVVSVDVLYDDAKMESFLKNPRFMR